MLNKRNAFIGAVILVIVTTVITFTVTSTLFFATSLFPNIFGGLGGKYSKISKITQVMNKYYVEPLEDKLLLEGAARGIVASVQDPYSHYMDAEEYAEMMEETSSQYAGIGIVVSVDQNDNLITVVSPFEDSPGEKAGILPGDKIVKVDGKEVWGDKLNEAVKMMKGPPGTEVTISIVRDKSLPSKDITIKRDIIKLQTIKHKVLQNNIGYIRITGFYQDTASDFDKSLKDLYDKKVNGLVIDLRNNPGGLLDQVVKITDKLVPKGLVVYTEDREKRRNEYTSNSEEINIPLAILINGGSASASEILSGAVKDHDKGVLVGTKTFGKGVVQTVIPLFDGSGISVTTSKYYTPNGISIHGIGINPDVEIELPEDYRMSISQINEEDDIQLKKAIEVLEEKIGK